MVGDRAGIVKFWAARAAADVRKPAMGVVRVFFFPFSSLFLPH
jgi:ABC-type Co2+ transport system permease subunit